jgi:protein ImuB
LYDPPRRIEVISLTLDGIPKWLRDDEGRHVVVHNIGPERLSPQWWRRPALFRSRSSTFKNVTRDYFKVQDERGRWLWVFRAHKKDLWFVHGEWA